MICKKCNKEKGDEFYKKDRTCKECRRSMVKENRKNNREYYANYDKHRYKNDPRVKARHKKYFDSERGREAQARSAKKWREMNPVKRAANVILGNAVRDGKIDKPDKCSKCGCEGRIHGHHYDYSLPLSVIWLCAKCHIEWHEINGEGKNAQSQ